MLKIKSNKTNFKLSIVALCYIIFSIVVLSNAANAQAFKDLQINKKPLILNAQGSFYVGGESVEQSSDEQGSFGPGGHITINQMYVRYMVPQQSSKLSVVMIHGMALTGKCWETTPDGKIGWDEYFVRKEFPVYIPDQVSRGRSGFNQAVFNKVRTGVAPAEQLPAISRFSNEVVWPNFRIGYKEGEAFPNELFPVNALNELAKQGVPDISFTPEVLTSNYKALSELSGMLIETVLISHSQSGAFPLEAALINPEGIKAMVLLEPGGISANYDELQIKTLAKIPTLIVFGDYLDEVPTGIHNFSWKDSYNSSIAFIDRINAAGGNATMWFLPEKGIRGNSHMLMHDTNNLKIADMIIKWIGKNVK